MNYTDRFGNTLAHTAAIYRTCDAFKYFNEQQINLLAKNNKGETAFTVALKNPCNPCNGNIISNHLKIADYYIEHFSLSQLEHKDIANYVEHCIRSGRESAVLTILKQYQFTADELQIFFDTAIENGYLYIAKQIVNPTITAKHLKSAFAQDRKDIAEFILLKPIDILAKDDTDKSAIQYAKLRTAKFMLNKIINQIHHEMKAPIIPDFFRMINYTPLKKLSDGIEVATTLDNLKEFCREFLAKTSENMKTKYQPLLLPLLKDFVKVEKEKVNDANAQIKCRAG